ncbi:hypothetical protein ACFV20_11795 [Streptomyces sp. NPDC059696]|uniref:hypothetical protein n=1 Tax=Streptomyces sp. NPDC059696 TaxID=3346911 RepID=UPI003682759B
MGALLAPSSAVVYGVAAPEPAASLEQGGAPVTGGSFSGRAPRRRHCHGPLGGLLLVGAALATVVLTLG